MNFSDALESLKAGVRIQRAGWNGKGMYICLQQGYPQGVPINANTAQATGMPVGSTAKFLPYIMMKVVAPEPTFVPWLASQTDILADDWEYFEQ